MHYWKFVSHDIPEFEVVARNSCVIQALIEDDKGDHQPLKDLHIATEYPYVERAGWRVGFAENLSEYWVETRLGINKVFALRKTDIRKYSDLRHFGIRKIVLVREKQQM